MKTVQSVLVAAALAIGMAAPALAGVNDPEVLIYRFPGVHDDGGGSNIGVATVFHCTNFSGVLETIRFAARNDVGTLMVNTTGGINHLFTVAAATHTVAAFSGAIVTTTAVNAGTMAIAATSINIICTAMIIDAANPKPTGVALRGIRFNPVPGSEE